ncbi:MAG: hypothetical protein EON60_11100 [Alphaproteobacteria bacterium]|nr:MAG: hypothetical protein EON60_11100 [Alphaproteobacteria bacterium]
MTPKLDIPISYAIFSKQLDYRRALEILAVISPEVKDLPYGHMLVENLTPKSAHIDRSSEYPALIVMSAHERSFGNRHLLESLHASRPVMVIEEFPDERYDEITFSHRALFTESEGFPRSATFRWAAVPNDEDELASRINARFYLGQPSGKPFTFQTRAQHPYISSSH